MTTALQWIAEQESREARHRERFSTLDIDALRDDDRLLWGTHFIASYTIADASTDPRQEHGPGWSYVMKLINATTGRESYCYSIAFSTQAMASRFGYAALQQYGIPDGIA